MINVFDFENGGEMESAKIKKSQYQVIPAERLEDYRKERLWGYLERSKMKNPEYFRLFDKNGSFVGFKRIITEFLPAAATRWQLDPVNHEPEASQKLSKPAMGTATLGREKIISAKQTQRRVTNPQSKDQSGSDARDRGRFLKELNEEPTPVPGKDEDVEPQEPKIDRGRYF